MTYMGLTDSIILLPIKFREEVLGVIELAGFRKLELHEISMLEGVAKGLGATIYLKNIRNKNSLSIHPE